MTNGPIDPRRAALQELVNNEHWRLVRECLRAKVDALQERVILRTYDSTEALVATNRDQAQRLLLLELLEDPLTALLDTDLRKDAPPHPPRYGAGTPRGDRHRG